MARKKAGPAYGAHSDGFGHSSPWHMLISMLGATVSLAIPVSVLLGGPEALLALAGAGAVAHAINLNRQRSRRRKSMYLLSRQDQDLDKLRGQLKGNDVLIAYFKKGTKAVEVFVGDRREPFEVVPKSATLSFNALRRAADKDENGDPVIIFFGRPL